MKFIKVGVLAASAAIVFAACSGGATTAPSAAPSEAPSEAPSGEPTAPPAEDPLGTVTIPAGEPLHVAYWGVLSGADANLGDDSKQGVEIAIDDLGGTFKGHDIRLTTEDGLCTPEGGATAAQKLAADTTIVGLIGSSCSDETVGGIAPLTNAGLTTISPNLAGADRIDRDAPGRATPERRQRRIQARPRPVRVRQADSRPPPTAAPTPRPSSRSSPIGSPSLAGRSRPRKPSPRVRPT
jgi:branched-chain amino acid transport system substrate-binding protein